MTKTQCSPCILEYLVVCKLCDCSEDFEIELTGTENDVLFLNVEIDHAL